jgi:hypothetical protein
VRAFRQVDLFEDRHRDAVHHAGHFDADQSILLLPRAIGRITCLGCLVNPRQHGIQPMRQELMRLFKTGDGGNSSPFPAIGDSQRGRWRRQALGNRVRRTAMEDALDSLLQQTDVDTLMLPDEQKIDEISRSRGAAALVRSRAGVQLLGDLPLQRNQPDLERVESELGQESRPPQGLSIPGIRWGDRDIHLEWLERPSGEGALQLVPHRQTDTRFAEFFTADDGEAKVVADVLDGGTLEIGAGCLGAVHVIGVQVDRNACPLTEPGLG